MPIETRLKFEKVCKWTAIIFMVLTMVNVFMPDLFVVSIEQEKLTLDNISKSFDKAVVVTKLFVSDAGADRTEIIEHTVYGTMLEFNTGFDGADSLYPEYKVMTDAEKKTVNSVVFAEDNKKFDFVELKED